VGPIALIGSGPDEAAIDAAALATLGPRRVLLLPGHDHAAIHELLLGPNAPTAPTTTGALANAPTRVGPAAELSPSSSSDDGGLPAAVAACAEPWRVFVNPSTSEVLCTATAEALAMGKTVVVPRCERQADADKTRRFACVAQSHARQFYCICTKDRRTRSAEKKSPVYSHEKILLLLSCSRHPSNEFFYQFSNCRAYGSPAEFALLLAAAARTAPKPPLDAELRLLSWAAATERLAAAIALPPARDPPQPSSSSRSSRSSRRLLISRGPRPTSSLGSRLAHEANLIFRRGLLGKVRVETCQVVFPT